MQTKILVTGASGLLGANMVLALLPKNYNVIAVSKNNVVRSKRIKSYQLDLIDKYAVFELMQREKPSGVIHCAALTNLDYCENNSQEALLNNAKMPQIIAEAAKEVGAKFVYISTDSVFDGITGNYNENDTTNPLNVYANSKLQGEEMVRDISADNLIVRVNIYGWNAQEKQSLGEWMLWQLEKNIEFNGFQDVIFNPLLVNDLSDIIIKMMEKSLFGVFNLGSSNSCSKYEFGQKIAKIFGLSQKLVRASSSDSVVFKTPRPKNTTLSTEKIEKELGMKMPSLEQGIKRFRKLREDNFVEKLKGLLETGK